jgi:Cof subfamily protein (haloacid dehalogenase superfamily)
MRELFVSDLDGTLLSTEGRLSDRSLAILTELLAGGLPFTVASARSAVSMRQVLRGLPLALPVVEYNGAYVSDLATGRHLRWETIPAQVSAEVLAAGARHALTPMAATFDGTEDRVHVPTPRNEGLAGYERSRLAAGDRRYRRSDDLAPAVREGVVCFSFLDRREVLEPLRDELQRDLGAGVQALLMPESRFPPWHWLAIYAGRATKAHALAALAEETGVPLSAMTAFGDQINDIPMLTACGRAVAVANAVDEVKRLAHATIGTNDEDSVALYLQRTWRA